MQSQLYEFIFRRKSTRQYEMAPLPDAQLAELQAFAAALTPLFPDIRMQPLLTTRVKNPLPVKAPHYFLFTCEEKPGCLEQVGFMGQQLDLFCASQGLGTCWLGIAKPADTQLKDSLPYVIALAVGKALQSPYRSLQEFKRKPLQEVSEGSDSRLEAARLAPSATNSQNWFFVAENGCIDVYQKQLPALQRVFYERFNTVDIGIALCHLALATQHEKGSYTFLQRSAPERPGYRYVGSLQ